MKYISPEYELQLDTLAEQLMLDRRAKVVEAIAPVVLNVPNLDYYPEEWLGYN